MSPKLRFILAGSVFLVILKFCTSAHAQEVGDQLQPGKLYGEAGLTTNWLEHGVSQSDKGYALQAGLGYRWSQFKLGMWGSGVKLPYSDDNLNLRIYMTYKFYFTKNADMLIRYDFNRYFGAGKANGTITSLDLNIFQYHILYEKNSNWEADDNLTRYGFMKDWGLPYNLTLTVNAGYNSISSDNYSSYFDIKTLVNYKYADILYSLGNSFNSNSGQFNGRGDLAFFLQLMALF